MGGREERREREEREREGGKREKRKEDRVKEQSLFGSICAKLMLLAQNFGLNCSYPLSQLKRRCNTCNIQYVCE